MAKSRVGERQTGSTEVGPRHPDDGPKAARAAAAAGRVRPIVTAVRPQVDGGRYSAKASVGQLVTVEADVFVDGHDELACEVRHRHDEASGWTLVRMRPLGDDRWRGGFPASTLGRHRFCVRAYVDRFGTWRRDLAAKAQADQPIALDLLVGAGLLEAAAERAGGADRRALVEAAAALREGAQREEAQPVGDGARAQLLELALGQHLARLSVRYPDRSQAAVSDHLSVVVEPERTRFSTWYELFPRSASPDPERPGTLADVIRRLPYLASLGVDVLYLPPVHPIGATARKGPGDRPSTDPSDPGSPWAIGSPDGGHDAVHPALGDLGDLERLVKAASAEGIDVALDLAFQCSPDHPWVGEHPEWFRHRPDGTIQYAENPPKRYQDIYPLDFECADWWSLWCALADVVEHWIGHGVTVFRVDNPHTKPFRFWEWLIAQVKAAHPEVIFLAEAFTRPKVMEHLAKVGFSQSYTYFAWRTTKAELEGYVRELTGTEVADYFRSNLWPNTPDILTAQLQEGSRAVFALRLVLAATLAASYGIYGPAFELQEHEAREPGSEEYRGSEKYEVRHWDLEHAGTLAPLVSRVNRARRDHPALQHDASLRFHHADNDQLLVYSKTSAGLAPRGGQFGLAGVALAGEAAFDLDVVVVVVNLDPTWAQAGWVDLDLVALGIDPGAPYELEDLLTGTRYRWEGSRNYVILDPVERPGHVLALVRPAARSIR